MCYITFAKRNKKASDKARIALLRYDLVKAPAALSDDDRWARGAVILAALSDDDQQREVVARAMAVLSDDQPREDDGASELAFLDGIVREARHVRAARHGG